MNRVRPRKYSFSKVLIHCNVNCNCTISFLSAFREQAQLRYAHRSTVAHNATSSLERQDRGDRVSRGILTSERTRAAPRHEVRTPSNFEDDHSAARYDVFARERQKLGPNGSEKRGHRMEY